MTHGAGYQASASGVVARIVYSRVREVFESTVRGANLTQCTSMPLRFFNVFCAQRV